MLLEGKGLGFRYDRRGVWLFRDRELSVSAGEIVGLAGPSGCGKTTLAKLLAGCAAPEEGEVRFDGKPLLEVKGCSPVQLVFQHPERAVNPRWRMRQIVEEGGRPEPLLLDAMGIAEEWLDRRPSELSGGELQRFCIARALGGQTRMLIADEMTTMLDAVTQAQIWNTVLGVVRQRELGLLVISHERPLLHRLCDRIVEWKS
ncbi:ABC transporter ATP-binding protein [Paenibacillus sp. NEAU-GSW1]|uniref:ABC transporter ATP-binding protein n=1 Tax=Paenibacillus sp. NEAU-GSW1 TaxID=2682486 RepID=UPI0012E2DABD|nr:ATP-binding cassette domain-containing protein [Paenibacillus sp. NEAU-GSW1]MUT67158.1 ATP-binding cassette domain-containing protein [Paenibacillus sp. NEAU-GSW1]